jgi:hypothetical protein
MVGARDYNTKGRRAKKVEARWSNRIGVVRPPVASTVFARQEHQARSASADVRATRETLGAETTVADLHLIRETRAQGQEKTAWAKQIEGELQEHSF